MHDLGVNLSLPGHFGGRTAPHGFATARAGCPARDAATTDRASQGEGHGGDPAMSVRSAAHSARNRRYCRRSRRRPGFLDCLIVRLIAPSRRGRPAPAAHAARRSASGTVSPAATRTIRPSFNCQYVPSRGARRRTASPSLCGTSNSSQSLVIFCASFSSISMIPGTKKPGACRGGPGFAYGRIVRLSRRLPERSSGRIACSVPTHAKRFHGASLRKASRLAHGRGARAIAVMSSKLDHCGFRLLSFAPCARMRARANAMRSSLEGGTAGRRAKRPSSVPPTHLAECLPVR